MSEQYSPEKAWEEGQAIRSVAEGGAKKNAHSATARDYDTASRNFDALRHISPEGTDMFIKQIATSYEQDKRLGHERKELLEMVVREIMTQLEGRVHAARAVLRDRVRTMELPREAVAEEALGMVTNMLRDAREEIIHDSRIVEAFAGDQELLEEIFGEEVLRENAKMFSLMLHVE